MILLDTSVLVYAVGAEHPLREPCRAVIAAVGDGTIAATTTVEVLQEFAHVPARRRGRDDGEREEHQPHAPVPKRSHASDSPTDPDRSIPRPW